MLRYNKIEIQEYRNWKHCLFIKLCGDHEGQPLNVAVLRDLLDETREPIDSVMFYGDVVEGDELETLAFSMWLRSDKRRIVGLILPEQQSQINLGTLTYLDCICYTDRGRRVLKMLTTVPYATKEEINTIKEFVTSFAKEGN